MAHRGAGRRGGEKMALSPAKQWEIGSPNAPSNNKPTAEETAQELIEILVNSELKPLYRVPTFRQAQADDVDPLNERVCGRYTLMGRRRRDYILLLVEAVNGRDTRWERRLISKELNSYEREVAALFKQIEDAGGLPVDVPEHFAELPVYVPKPKRSNEPKPKRRG